MKKILFLLTVILKTYGQDYESKKDCEIDTGVYIDMNITEKCEKEISELQKYIVNQLNPNGTQNFTNCYFVIFCPVFSVKKNDVDKIIKLFEKFRSKINKDTIINFDKVDLTSTGILFIKFKEDTIEFLQSFCTAFAIDLVKNKIISAFEAKRIMDFIPYIVIGKFNQNYLKKREKKLNSFINKRLNKLLTKTVKCNSLELNYY